MKRIIVVGTGFVGLSNAVLLARSHRAIALDVSAQRVVLLQQGHSPIADTEIEECLAHKSLDLQATLDKAEAYHDADIVIIATPTNYGPISNHFDTSTVQVVLALNPEALTVIKSSVPVGFTERLKRETGSKHIIFSPEFLREGKALHDNLYPCRIVVGKRSAHGQMFPEQRK